MHVWIEIYLCVYTYETLVWGSKVIKEMLKVILLGHQSYVDITKRAFRCHI